MSQLQWGLSSFLYPCSTFGTVLLEAQKKAWERAKIERRRAYDARMERAMEALENITDSKSAADFVREAKEKKRLEAEAAQLKAVDIRMETGVKRLREMKRNGSNATAEEKEQLAEEVKDDMMKLEMEVRLFVCL